MPVKIICAILMLLTVGSVSATKPANATIPPLALDGVGRDTRCQTACVSQLLTTSQGNDVILLVAECGYTECDYDEYGVIHHVTVSSITDSSGLTFLQRVAFAPNDKLWEYYAVAALPLQSDNITVVFSEPSGLKRIQVLAVHGASTTNIFDRNPTLPSAVECPGWMLSLGEYGTCSTSIKVSNLDFVIAVTAINDAPPCGGYPTDSGAEYKVPGFTTIVGGGQIEVDYAIVPASLANIAFTCVGTGVAWYGTDPEAVIMDAIAFRGAFGA